MEDNKTPKPIVPELENISDLNNWRKELSLDDLKELTKHGYAWSMFGCLLKDGKIYLPVSSRKDR